MIVLGMLFVMLVLGPLVMLIAFAIIRSDRAMSYLHRFTFARPQMPDPAESEPEA